MNEYRSLRASVGSHEISCKNEIFPIIKVENYNQKCVYIIPCDSFEKVKYIYLLSQDSILLLSDTYLILKVY